VVAGAIAYPTGAAAATVCTCVPVQGCGLRGLGIKRNIDKADASSVGIKRYLDKAGASSVQAFGRDVIRAWDWGWGWGWGSDEYSNADIGIRYSKNARFIAPQDGVATSRVTYMCMHANTHTHTHTHTYTTPR
jgi:hypothetical protein